MAEAGGGATGIDIDGLARMASPLYAALSGREGGSSAGPAAAALRLAARKFVASVRGAAAEGYAEGAGGEPLVALAAAAGVSGVAAAYGSAGGGPARHASAVQGEEHARVRDRVRALAAGAALGAARRLGEVRSVLSPLSKFVDGARVVAVGPSGADLYPRFARAVVLASVAGAASLTLSGGALARPTAVELQAQQSGASIDDLFRKTFGNVRPAVTPGAVSPGAAASALPVPAARPAVPAPAVAAPAGFEGPSPAFRTMAKAYLAVHGGNGDGAAAVLDALLLDARTCAARFGTDTRCKVYRDDVGIDLARGRFEIRSPDGTGKVLVQEARGSDLEVLDPAGFNAVLQGADHYEATPRDRSERKVDASGRVYHEPSQSFRQMASALVRESGESRHDAYLDVEDLVGKSVRCLSGGAPGGCAANLRGVSVDVSKGEFALYGTWYEGQDPVLLVRETVQGGLQVVNPSKLALAMGYAVSRPGDGHDPSPTMAGQDAPGLGARMR